MDDFEVVNPSLEYKEDVIKFLEEVKIVDKDFYWQYAGMANLEEAESYEEWINDKNSESKGINLPDGYVSASTFLTIRKSDRKVIGIFSIRHELNDFLFNSFGHIGQSIRPSERGKGYGKVQLLKALEKAHSLGITNVLLACNELNIASAKTIESCFGVYEKTTKFDNEVLRRYWIDTEKIFNLKR